MKTLVIAAAAVGMCIGSVNLAVAKDRDHGMSARAPGHEMQEHGSVPGSPGASGFTRGHLYNRANDRDRDMMEHRGHHDR